MNERVTRTRELPGKWASLGLTIAVHLGLALFLFFGVRWQSSPPAALEVQLAAAPSTTPAPPKPQPAPRPEPPKPQPAPEPPRPQPAPEPPKPQPRPEPPKPEPPKAAPAPAPKPEIATKAPEKKPEPPKPAPKPEPKPEPKPAPKPEPKPAPKPEPKPKPAPKPEPKPEPKPQPKPEPKPAPKPEPKPAQDDYMAQRLAQETRRAEEARLDNLLRQEGARAAAAGDVDRYRNAIATKVRGNLLRPPGLAGNPEAIFEVDQLPSGEVLNVRLKRSSGVPALDDAIERAIRRSSPLPLPENRSLFQRTLELKFRPLAED
ncbi:energy transducer TonB [Thauera sp. WH-1]|uniref:energy transducer TonB n=1 Tax=Thauera sp. WH-1 TaxID=3398230 RepID=UPI0039FDD59C